MIFLFQTREVEVGCEQEFRLGDGSAGGSTLGRGSGLRLDPEALRLRSAGYIRVQVRGLQFWWTG